MLTKKERKRMHSDFIFGNFIRSFSDGNFKLFGSYNFLDLSKAVAFTYAKIVQLSMDYNLCLRVYCLLYLTMQCIPWVFYSKHIRVFAK